MSEPVELLSNHLSVVVQVTDQKILDVGALSGGFLGRDDIATLVLAAQTTNE